MAARRFLRARQSSVFLTPVRGALLAATHADATAASRSLAGFGLSRQSYALAPKILEVESWLPTAPCPVHEVHPEVSFAVLLGEPAAPKKSWAGMVQRRRALAAAGIELEDVDGPATLAGAVDDILDAAVAAWTARRLLAGCARPFPDPPSLGSSGRPVAIWA